MVSLAKIVFLGTPQFAVPFLNILVANNLKPSLVITQPDKPTGRSQQLTPPPIKLPALMEHIEVKQPSTKKDLAAILKIIQPDVCILVAYGMIIDKQILNIPKHGFINAHPSLLPKYRGSSPVQTAILNGDEFSGITLIKLDSKIDHGPIIAQEKLPILENDNNQTLHDRLAVLGADLLARTLPDYLAGRLKPVEQDHIQATMTKEIDRSAGQIDWSKSALEIERQFRAYSPWPGVFTHSQQKRLKLTVLGLLEGDFGADLAPGTVFLGPNKGLAVACGQGAILVERLQLEGKKEMGSVEFLRGMQNILGQRLT